MSQRHWGLSAVFNGSFLRNTEGVPLRPDVTLLLTGSGSPVNRLCERLDDRTPAFVLAVDPAARGDLSGDRGQWYLLLTSVL